MTPSCVCGHQELVHIPGCLKWWLGCNCIAFEPDDGLEHGVLSVRTETYDGRYGRRYPA